MKKTLSSAERLKVILSELKTNKNALSKQLGYSNNVGLTNIESGKYNFSTALANRIITKFPQFNYEWILKGKGTMLINVEKYSHIQGFLDGLRPMPRLNERIKKIIDVLYKGDVTIFSEKLLNTIPQEKINRLFDIDKKTKQYPTIPDDVLIGIAMCISEINLEWLFRGNEEMLKSEQKSITPTINIPITQQMLKMLEGQLETKDKQIADLTAALNAKNAVPAGVKPGVVKTAEAARKRKAR